MRSRPPSPGERGMALPPVMLLVAMMSAIAVSVVDDLRFGLRRSGNAAAIAQARWYAIGAETFAGVQLRRIAALDSERTIVTGGWLEREQRFPIEGGLIVARLRDAGNCFNLNALRAGLDEDEEEPPPLAPGDAPAAKPMQELQLRALLIALEISPRDAEDVTDAVKDWIDSDAQRSGAGWEDDRYARLKRPYRTAGTALAEVNELRAMAPVTPEIYRALRPFVCVLPGQASAWININTIREDQAELFTMLSAGAISLGQARQIIASRPADGWSTVQEFVALPFAQALSDPRMQGALTVKTRYYGLDTRVNYKDAEVFSSALLEQIADDHIVTRMRRWTPDE